jgi:hypothetical protein
MLYDPKWDEKPGNWGARCERCGERMKETVLRDDKAYLHIVFECENCDETAEATD